MGIVRLFWVLVLSLFMVGNVYAKNCKKGKACGNTCIASWKDCHVGSGSSSNSSFDSSLSDYSLPNVSSPSYSSSRRSKRRKSTYAHTPTASYTSPRRNFSSNTSDDQEEKKKSPVMLNTIASKVLDSDILEISKKQYRKISLYGIDAPEEDQPFGQEAREFFTKKVFKKKIKAKIYGKKDDDTNTALVFAGGKNINELMIKAGYAWVYQPSCDESFCGDWVRYEEEARNQKKGLWSESGRVAPWIWR